MVIINGFSNFSVNIVFMNNVYLISKKGFDKDIHRLTLQIQKQELFQEKSIFLNVKIPKIISFHKTSNYIEYFMEYIYNSENIIEFIENNNNIRINWLINKIINLVDNFINFSTLSKIPKILLDNKITDIYHNLHNNINVNTDNILFIFDYLNKHIDTICSYDFPIGICHGDLTLSNILIDTNNMNLYLIDFLDSFLESPIVDIVKLRQDTFFNWTSSLCTSQKYDKNKIKICMLYIDDVIDTYFTKYNWYSSSYIFFQYINILRILQYSKNSTDSNNIIRMLQFL